MNSRIKLIISVVLLMVSLGSMAQDKTKTKNNKAEIYDNLYELYTEIKKHRSDSLCIQMCDSMRMLAIKQGDKRAIAMSYAHPVSYYMNISDEKHLFEYVDLLMKASEEAELWSFYYHAQNQKSVYLLRSNRVAETIEMAKKMMEKAYAVNNKNGIYSSHSILVNCYLQQRLYDAALTEAEKALQAEIGLPDNEFGNSLAKVSEIHLMMSDYQAGLDALAKYGHLVESKTVKSRLAEHKAFFYYFLEKKNEFQKAYQEVLSMYDAYGETTGENKNILKVQNLYLQGKLKEAEVAASQLPSGERIFYLSKLYRDTHNADSLYHMLNISEKVWRDVHKLLYEDEVMKYSNELDNQNMKLREKEMLDKQREVRVISILVFFAVCLLFAGVLYWREQRSRRKLQRAYTKLNNQKIQLEEQLVAVKEANMANDAKTSFLFNMSHDIRTPMNAILGFSNLLEKEKDNPEKVSDYLGKIKSSGQFLLSLINNVLDMARIESGKMELDEDFCDVLDAKNNTVELFLDMAKRKHITLTYTHQIEHRYVLLDQMKVRQIILNLVSNAVKYTPDGGSVTFRIEELPCEREGYVTFVSTISDTGIGMSPEYAKSIFDMFSRERNTTESKQEGTGLGMSIVKRLVDLMGGTIEVETELGKGTTFRVTMSHAIVENPEQYLNRELSKEKEDYSIEGKRILLAEDNDMNAEIAMVILEELGLVVERAEDGVQCVKMLSESEAGYYDAILMDVQMPNMNGYEATKAIRKLQDKTKANIPILAMTANAFEEDKKNATEVGMNGHLAKPIDVAELMKCLGQVLID